MFDSLIFPDLTYLLTISKDPFEVSGPFSSMFKNTSLPIDLITSSRVGIECLDPKIFNSFSSERDFSSI